MDESLRQNIFIPAAAGFGAARRPDAVADRTGEAGAVLLGEDQQVAEVDVAGQVVVEIPVEEVGTGGVVVLGETQQVGEVHLVVEVGVAGERPFEDNAAGAYGDAVVTRDAQLGAGGEAD